MSSKNTLPAFVGGEGFEAYMLAENSPLIGCGYNVEDDLTVDFFGNEITSAYIGCYSAEGEDGEVKTENIIEKIFRFFRQLFFITINETKKIIEDI